MNPPRPICPKCHLAITEDQPWVLHQGKRYHRACSPPTPEPSEGNVPDDGPMFI